MRLAIVASFVFATVVAGCSDDPASGTLEVRVYGEAFIEDGIPADVFVDGWTVSFDKFLVSLGHVAAQAGHDHAELTDPSFKVFDLAVPSGGAGFLVATFDAPGGTYDHFGYVIKPDAAATAANADAADVTALQAAGHSVRVVGTATRGAQTVRFDWGFALSITHSHCESAAKVDDNTAVTEATIHGDHLFYDDAVSAEPNVAFDLIAASDGADGTAADGVVTPAELAAKDLTAEARYQVGSLDIHDLWGFVSHQVGTLGHANGEGHCEDVRVTGT